MNLAINETFIILLDIFDFRHQQKYTIKFY